MLMLKKNYLFIISLFYLNTISQQIGLINQIPHHEFISVFFKWSAISQR